LANLIARAHRACEQANRDPASIEINAMFGRQLADPLAGAAQLADMGVGRCIVPGFVFAGLGGLDRLSEFGECVIKKVNS
jgi:hypothetical protein